MVGEPAAPAAEASKAVMAADRFLILDKEEVSDLSLTSCASHFHRKIPYSY